MKLWNELLPFGLFLILQFGPSRCLYFTCGHFYCNQILYKPMCQAQVEKFYHVIFQSS